MKTLRPACALAVLAGGMFTVTLRAQAPNPLMSPKDLDAACVRVTQLMDAGGVVAPDLGRASAPVIENVKQACEQIKLHPTGGQATFALLTNVHAYLELADTIPKPYPFPQIGQQQENEVRDISTKIEAHFRALLESKEAQLVQPDMNDLDRYAEANRKLPPSQPGKPRVVFLGDSITDLWRLNEYFPDRDFINRGISGQIAPQMLARMKADVIDLRPAAVVILAGTNDLAREIPLTAIEDDYLMLADLAGAARIKVIFASVLPVSDAHKAVDPAYERTPTHPLLFIRALNDWLKAFCTQRGYTFLDYYPALADSSGQLAEDLSDDGLHPNAKGYRVMAPLLLAAVNKSVGPAPPQAPPRPPSGPVTQGKNKAPKDASK